MSEKTPGQAAYEAFTAVRYAGSLTTAWTSPTVAHKAWDTAAAAAIDAMEDERDKYRDVLTRLADEDTWVLGEGFGGGFAEEHHVRASLARQALGLDVDCCTECMVSLGIEPEDDE